MKIEHESIVPVENPETGQKAYPYATANGSPVLANGAVEECDCEPCLARYER